MIKFNANIHDSLALKFIYSEKATKFWEISILFLTVYGTVVKSKVEISQNFVTFSEYMNFTWCKVVHNNPNYALVKSWVTYICMCTYENPRNANNKITWIIIGHGDDNPKTSSEMDGTLNLPESLLKNPSNLPKKQIGIGNLTNLYENSFLWMLKLKTWPALIFAIVFLKIYLIEYYAQFWSRDQNL